jgi:sialate O-acetylesterase
MRKAIVCVIVIGLFEARMALANVCLPTLIGDNMVLQRDARIGVWGWADPGETVRIAFHGVTINAKADRSGRWTGSVGPFDAGGPYEMTLKGKNSLLIRNILIGDVWLASGQSNMEFPLKRDGDFGGADNADREIAEANFPKIRLFKVHHTVGLNPQKNVEADKWGAVTPETVGGFSAVAYLFGRELHQRYHVPIGLIESNWGGTVAEAWISESSLRPFPEFAQASDSLKKIDEQAAAKLQSDPNTPTLLFNGMIAPLTPYRIKGVIWYQGEANADRPIQYRTLFAALIKNWRLQWGYDFPFLFVQLAGFQPNKAQPADYQWAELREAQSMALSLPYTGMATAVDVGDERDIHPRNKQDVAHRLALAAAKVAYGENIVTSGPVYRSMQIDGNQIKIEFSDLGSGLLIKDKYGYARGFEIAGADGKFVWAKARLDGDYVLVSSEVVPQPAAVRYDWSNTPDGNIFNREGLPALPFRTDSPQRP